MDIPVIDPISVDPDEKTDYLRERMEGAFLPRVLTYIGSKIRFLSKAMSVMGRILERWCPFLFRF